MRRLRWLALAGGLLALVACTEFGYYGQALRGQVDLLSRRQDIQTLLRDPTLDDDLRQRLRQALDIRDFASDALGLPDNGSYRSFADLQRSALVWNVFAAPPFDVELKTWCYPLIGCAAYRGYFHQADAEREAEPLRNQGLEVYVAPIPAYSTLGWFDDPLPSTVIRWPEHRLAALIFHELAHQVVYISDDTDFNESFAHAVEREGLRRWVAAHGRGELACLYRREREDARFLSQQVLDTRERLRALYAQDLTQVRMAEHKARILDSLRDQIRQRWGENSRYRKWLGDLNNARLGAVSAYELHVPAFLALLAEAGGDLPAFYRAVEQLGGRPAEERATRLTQLATSFVEPSLPGC